MDQVEFVGFVGTESGVAADVGVAGGDGGAVGAEAEFAAATEKGLAVAVLADVACREMPV